MGGPDWSMPSLEPFAWAHSAGAAPDADLDDVYDPSHTEHNVHIGLTVGHVATTIGEIYEFFHVTGAVLAPPAHGAAAVAVWAAPLGAVLVAVTTVLELHKAFTTTQRIMTQEGICYGLMWEVLGMPDAERTTRGTFFGEMPMTDSEREAWEEGVREGREKARDPAVREAIVRALAYEMAVQGRDPDTDPTHRAWQKAVNNTLNRIWNEVHEDLGPLNGSTIPWMGDQDGFPKRRPQP
jgi:hypothetical protein